MSGFKVIAQIVLYLSKAMADLVDLVTWIIFKRRLTPLTEESLLEGFTREEKYDVNGLLSTALVDPVWYDGFGVVVKCFREDPTICALGRIIIDMQMRRLLRNRLNIYKSLSGHDYPEFQISRPIFLIGPMRSGTTLLQELLVLDDRHTSPLFYESRYPVRISNSDIVKRVKIFMDINHFLFPSLRSIHDLGHDKPHECCHLLEHSFISKYVTMCCQGTNDYIKWLRTRTTDDMVKVYQLHKLQLQLILGSRSSPTTPQQRLVLKDSIHCSNIEALLTVYPDAILVHTYRNPVTTVASGCSMAETFRNFYCKNGGINFKRLGHQMLTTPLFNGGNELVRYRKSHPEHEDKFIDIQYQELEDDPISVLKSVYERVGVKMTDDTLRNLEAYVKEHPRHKHGVHRYNLEKYGISERDVREYFKEYIQYFEK